MMHERSLNVMENVSVISVLTLSSLTVPANVRFPLFALTLLCYSVMWLANVTVIVTIVTDKNLHEPMYVFLCNLCVNGLYGTAGFYPKFLTNLWRSTQVISYAGCLAQGFVVHSSACADITLLLLMAYDRYVAICRPLVYNSVMTKERVGVLVFFAWFFPVVLILVGTITTSLSRLCGSHVPKIYCINFLLGKLACTASLSFVIVPAVNYTFSLLCFSLIVYSYAYLVKKCLFSSENRHKFMQTCLPHLICLCTFIGALAFDLLYMRFGQETLPQAVKNFMAIEFILIPPIVNPLIYGFKLTKIRTRIARIFTREK